MAGKKFTRYFRDPAFREAVDQQFAHADQATVSGKWITYAIHDPTLSDAIANRVEGTIIYVGQSKEFRKRVRKRFRNAGTAVGRPKDRIDGACYDIMARGGVPRFSVLETTENALDSLVSETNWTKRLRAAGYRLLNQWTEQKFGGRKIDRHKVPHNWIWPLTAEDAVGSRIDLVVSDLECPDQMVADLAAFPPNTRLREIRDLLKGKGRQSRIVVR
jgi:hypothetical protein